ncbi:hypothetical protein CB1_000688039 [Camelus ferus]|nr:hypothetical protein CB1_000688039 [Camelus ferus]
MCVNSRGGSGELRDEQGRKGADQSKLQGSQPKVDWGFQQGLPDSEFPVLNSQLLIQTCILCWEPREISFTTPVRHRYCQFLDALKKPVVAVTFNRPPEPSNVGSTAKKPAASVDEESDETHESIVPPLHHLRGMGGAVGG